MTLMEKKILAISTPGQIGNQVIKSLRKREIGKTAIVTECRLRMRSWNTHKNPHPKLIP